MRRALLLSAGALSVLFLSGVIPLAVHASWSGGPCSNLPPSPIRPGVYPVSCFLTFTSDDSLVPQTSGTVSWNGTYGNVSTLLTVANPGNRTLDVTVIQVDNVVDNYGITLSAGSEYLTSVTIPPGRAGLFPGGYGETVSYNVVEIYYVIAAANVAGLRGLVVSLQSQVVSLRADLASVNASLIATRANLTVVSHQLSLVEQQLSTSKANASGLATEAARLQTIVTTDDARIENLSSTLSVKNQQLLTTENMLASAQSSLGTYSNVYLPAAVFIPSAVAGGFAILYFRKRTRKS